MEKNYSSYCQWSGRHFFVGIRQYFTPQFACPSVVQRHQVLTPQSHQIKQFRISVQFLTHPQSYSVLTKQYALLNKMHTHTSQMTFNGIATMFLLVDGSMIRSGYQQLLWQLGTVTVDLSIGSKSARTCVSSFAITFTKVFTPPNCLCIK